MPDWNWVGFVLIIPNNKLRDRAWNTKYKWEGPSSGKWACWVWKLSAGVGKEQQVHRSEVGHEVRENMYYYKLQTGTTIPSYKQHTCAGSFCLKVVITFTKISFLGDFWMPRAKWQMSIWWWQWQDLGCYTGSLLILFPSQSVNFASWPRWTKGGQHGIRGVCLQRLSPGRGVYLRWSSLVRYGHLILHCYTHSYREIHARYEMPCICCCLGIYGHFKLWCAWKSWD